MKFDEKSHSDTMQMEKEDISIFHEAKWSLRMKKANWRKSQKPYEPRLLTESYFTLENLRNCEASFLKM